MSIRTIITTAATIAILSYAMPTMAGSITIGSITYPNHQTQAWNNTNNYGSCTSSCKIVTPDGGNTWVAEPVNKKVPLPQGPVTLNLHGNQTFPGYVGPNGKITLPSKLIINENAEGQL